MKKNIKNKLAKLIMGLDGRVTFSEYVWDEVKLQPEYWSKRLIFIYRLGRINLYYTKKNTLRKKLWRKIYLYLNIHITEGKLNSHIPASLYIGKGTKFYHPYSVMINSHAYIGGGSILRHNVTIGNVGRFAGDQASPRIEYGTSIGAGASIIGDITIGHHAKIGTNAVVNKSFPDYAILVGMPAVNKNKTQE
ncbi:MAG: hypothetical protein LBT80_02590 [Lactobacillaceae bacterium]|jgi:serine acetyltransferase|nr:hypothetical protein [Lactobacillaceae bacterium]